MFKSILFKCFLVIVGIIVAILLIKTQFQIEDSYWRSRRIDKTFQIPPELVEGKVVNLGDSYDTVSKIFELEPHKFYEQSSPDLVDVPGIYSASPYYYSIRFNKQNKLVLFGISVPNKDSLSTLSFFQTTARMMMKYYGKKIEIYNRKGFPSVRILRWQLDEKNTVYLNGHINSDSLKGGDSNTIYISYNDSFLVDNYPINTKESIEDYGLE